MEAIVIDARIPIGLILRLPWSETAQRAFLTWRREEVSLIAPTLWLYEAVSALRKAVAMRLLDREVALERVSQIPLLGIQIAHPDTELLLSSLRWAEKLGQTKTYDAQYVALAERVGAELWSVDQRLVRALREAEAPWAHWIGEFEEQSEQ